MSKLEPSSLQKRGSDPLHRTSSTDSFRGESEPWRLYPFNLASYNPLNEWGEWYNRIFELDIWAHTTNSIVQDLSNGVVFERRISGPESLDDILKEDPDIRIFYCDSKLCDDLVTRASFSAEDIKKIFFKYDLSIVFVDRFIGRNRCTTGSRKLYDPDDPSQIRSYDIWYDLPCRIYGADHEYNWHFILFTVYVHYDAIRKKTVLFYIHRLGSEHPSSGEKSSRGVKDRVKISLEYIANNRSHIATFKSCPFIVQQPTITSSVIFWTETLHKERLSMWKKEDDGKKDIANIDTFDMHNISRYVHSYAANIEILQRTLHFLKAEHIWFSKNATLGRQHYSSPWYEQMTDTIESQIFQADVIIVWTKEVLKRTTILIELHFNQLAKINSTTTGKIMEETQKEAISMRTIAFVTMFFLPATFVSSFFDLPFFQSGVFNELPHVWIYFVIVFALTIVILTVWRCWLLKKYEKIQKNEAHAFLRKITEDFS